MSDLSSSVRLNSKLAQEMTLAAAEFSQHLRSLRDENERRRTLRVSVAVFFAALLTSAMITHRVTRNVAGHKLHRQNVITLTSF